MNLEDALFSLLSQSLLYIYVYVCVSCVCVPLSVWYVFLFCFGVVSVSQMRVNCDTNRNIDVLLLLWCSVIIARYCYCYYLLFHIWIRYTGYIVIYARVYVTFLFSIKLKWWIFFWVLPQCILSLCTEIVLHIIDVFQKSIPGSLQTKHTFV